MKKHTGEFSRCTLSYDMTFFALIRLSLAGTEYTIRRRRCAAHPTHRRPMMEDSAELAYTARISALLSWYKVRDTVSDEHGMKKLGAMALLPCASTMKRSASSEEEAAAIIERAMTVLADTEREKCPEPDRPADIFGGMLGELMALGFDERAGKIAHEIGLHLGRWVYLADAICDYAEDGKSGAYNPFRLAYPEDAAMAEFVRGTAAGVLSYEVTAALHAVELIDFGDDRMLYSCIENILCDGLESALALAWGREEIYGERPV